MDDATLKNLEERLDDLEARGRDLEQQLSDPAVITNQELYRRLMKQHAELLPVVECYQRYRAQAEARRDAEEMLAAERDPDMRELARQTLDEADAAIPDLLQQLQLLLVPKDPLDDKNVILEIRAGTGGDEAALFAADLYRMYLRYAELQGWRVELMDQSETELGGFREVVVLLSGEAVYSRLKWESGVHRVQRVPRTETQGRIHTSAATVAVLPEAEEVDVQINANDLVIDVYRSQGPGGQSVNTTDSAVRITHKPSGLVVTCQDEKSQLKNKAKALKVLRSRLLDLELKKQAEERAGARKSMVGSGDRSERIRTYNFPQNRLTDHRINLTLYSLDRVMEGAIDELFEALNLEDRARRLAEATGA